MLSDEVERVVKLSPEWKAGSQNGKDVAVQYYTFVEFNLRQQTDEHQYSPVGF